MPHDRPQNPSPSLHVPSAPSFRPTSPSAASIAGNRGQSPVASGCSAPPSRQPGPAERRRITSQRKTRELSDPVALPLVARCGPSLDAFGRRALARAGGVPFLRSRMQGQRTENQAPKLVPRYVVNIVLRRWVRRRKDQRNCSFEETAQVPWWVRDTV